MYTTQKEVREAFWEAFPAYAKERRSRKSQNDYRADIRVAFIDFIEALVHEGAISENLSYKVTL